MGGHADRVRLVAALFNDGGVEAFRRPEVVAAMREFVDPALVARSTVMLDGRDYHGLDGLLEMYREFDRVWNGMTYAVGEVVEQGDEFVAELRYSGRGALSRVPVDQIWWVHNRYRDGKLVLLEYVGSREEAMRRAGFTA